MKRKNPEDADLATLANGTSTWIAEPMVARMKRGFGSFRSEPKHGKSAPRVCSVCRVHGEVWAVPQGTNHPWGVVLRVGDDVWGGVRRATGPYATRVCTCDIAMRRTMLTAQGTGALLLCDAAYTAGTTAEAWMLPAGSDLATLRPYVHPALAAIHEARHGTRPLHRSTGRALEDAAARNAIDGTYSTHAEDRATLARWLTEHEDSAAWRAALDALAYEPTNAPAVEYLHVTRDECMAWFDEWTVRGARWKCLGLHRMGEGTRSSIYTAAATRMEDRAAGHRYRPQELHDVCTSRWSRGRVRL